MIFKISKKASIFKTVYPPILFNYFYREIYVPLSVNVNKGGDGVENNLQFIPGRTSVPILLSERPSKALMW